jgi:hypothetical protein
MKIFLSYGHNMNNPQLFRPTTLYANGSHQLTTKEWRMYYLK